MSVESGGSATRMPRVCVALQPQTGGDSAAAFVAATLVLQLSADYPATPPDCSWAGIKGAAALLMQCASITRPVAERSSCGSAPPGASLRQAVCAPQRRRLVSVPRICDHSNSCASSFTGPNRTWHPAAPARPSAMRRYTASSLETPQYLTRAVHHRQWVQAGLLGGWLR